MSKECFDCGKPLEWTGSGLGYLNSDQWDAVKAGDYYRKCEYATHPNGNCYFWDTEGIISLKRSAPPTHRDNCDCKICVRLQGDNDYPSTPRRGAGS
jgi:hypothetical protein